MKNLLIVILVSFLFSGILISQNSLGISTNFNFATIKGSGIDTDKDFLNMETANFGTIGINYERMLDPNWTLITGLNYARKGGKSKVSENIELFGQEIELGARLVHRMGYLEVPALFQYKFNSNKSKVSPFIFFGPLFSYETGYEIGVKAHILVDINLFSYDVDLGNDVFNRYDIAAMAGGGLSIPVRKGEIKLNASYVYGFMDVLDDPVLDFNLKHRNIRTGIAYVYNF
ncbi:MAG: outer membrane beta-barrel protein [Deltaproteobacteria bacterium]